jgi:hypothetical protein
MVQNRKRGKKIDSQSSYFLTPWKHKPWDDPSRFIFTCKRTQRQQKGLSKLDLFEPRDFNFDHKWFLLNKLFGIMPSEIADMEGLKGSSVVRQLIIRVSDQLRAGEIRLCRWCCRGHYLYLCGSASIFISVTCQHFRRCLFRFVMRLFRWTADLHYCGKQQVWASNEVRCFY